MNTVLVEQISVIFAAYTDSCTFVFALAHHPYAKSPIHNPAVSSARFLRLQDAYIAIQQASYGWRYHRRRIVKLLYTRYLSERSTRLVRSFSGSF